MRGVLVSVGLVIALLAPTRARAECDAEAVRAIVIASPRPLARMLRAHRETDEPERWRAGPVTIGEPVIAPILANGCSAALVEYTWTATDRRAPAFRRWRHGVAVLAVRDGRVRLVARHALVSVGSEPPQYHGVSFETGAEPVVVVSIGGGGSGGGWGGEQRLHLVGHRLVPELMPVGDLGRLGH